MFEHVDLFRPPLPAWLIALCIVGAAAAALYLYAARQDEASWVRRVALVALRGAALAAVAWVLAGPSVLRSDDPEQQRVPVVILADTSASMAEPDVTHAGEPLTRWGALERTWLNGDYLARLSDVAQVSLIGFDETPRPLALDAAPRISPAGKETRLFDALRHTATTPALLHGSGAVVLLLSDGHDTAEAHDPRVADRLRAQGVPVFAVPVGELSSVADVSVQAWAEADFLLAGQATTLHASILQRGFAGRRVRVDLLHEGRLLHSETIDFESATAQRVSWPVTPPEPESQAVAVHGYTVRATLLDAQDQPAPDDAETLTDNNERQVFVQVSRERVRVALFEGEPYWETRFLARLLHADPQVELTAAYHLGPERQVAVASEGATALDAAQLDQATLNNFDVVVLGQRAERFFPGDAAAMLVDFVQQRGGALVLARGRPFGTDTAEGRRAMALLEPIAPVAWGEAQVRELGLELTPEGRQSPLLRFEDVASADAVITELPGMIAATRIEREKAASVILLRQAAGQREGERAMAAVAYLRAGRGRVLGVLTDGLWRWGLLPRGLERYEPVYQRFWRRAVQWLATGGEFLPGQQVSLSLSRLTVEPGEAVEVRVSTRYVAAEDFSPRVRVIGPEGVVETLEPARDGRTGTTWTATLRPRKTGVHRVELTAPGQPDLIAPETPLMSRLAVYDRSMERLDPSARPEVLKALTDATGGRCLALDERDALLEHLAAIHTARQRDVEPRYDFARLGVFALIAGCLGMEWLLRRREGLM